MPVAGRALNRGLEHFARRCHTVVAIVKPFVEVRQCACPSDLYKPCRRRHRQYGGMNIDLDNALAFMTSHARVLDRHRFDQLTGRGDAAKVLAALAAYRNDDGGYGHALEPDLRSRGSQPAGALHAFEVFDEIGPSTSPDAGALCDWLESVSEPDGGLAFVLPIDDPTGCAQVWVDAAAAAEGSTIHMTALVAAVAHRVARHDRRVADHPWLGRATDYSLARIATIDEPAHAYELRSILLLLDAMAPTDPRAADELRRFATFVPESGALPVHGGVEGEELRVLEFSPYPDTPLREHVAKDLIDAELDRLGTEQRPDGGWTVDFAMWSPAGALEWRGDVTVHAIRVLRDHGRLPWPVP